MRKIWKFISSMQFAIGLLLILAVTCSVGSVITQGQSYDVYAAQYGERVAGAIMALSLDDIFHCWWFVCLSAFLCLNLLLCNLIRIPSILEMMRREADPAFSLGKKGGVSAEDIRDVDGFFKALGFLRVVSGETSSGFLENENPPADRASAGSEPAGGDTAGAGSEDLATPAAASEAGEDTAGVGDEDLATPAAASEAESAPDKAPPGRIGETRPYRFAVRNRIGLWGAWICHLGILLLILGFGLGQATKEEYTVYGLPGDSLPVGDTGCVLTINSFDVGLREDDTVEQYTADITVRRPQDGAAESARISVNNPASIFGMKYYQNSTGWAADIHIQKNGEPLQDDVIYVGDYVAVEDMPDLVVFLNAFYPDYVMGETGPMTASSSLKNPAYLYSVYYMSRMLGMNALLESEELTIDDYRVTFDHPRNFTLIQVKKDRFTVLALIGGLLVMLGLVLAFYFQSARVWAVRKADGTWSVQGYSRKGGALFDDHFKEVAEKYRH